MWVMFRMTEVRREVFDLFDAQEVLLAVGETMQIDSRSVQLVGQVPLPQPMGTNDLTGSSLAGGAEHESSLGRREPPFV
jgi:hypothetical protein